MIRASADMSPHAGIYFLQLSVHIPYINLETNVVKVVQPLEWTQLDMYKGT